MSAEGWYPIGQSQVKVELFAGPMDRLERRVRDIDAALVYVADLIPSGDPEVKPQIKFRERLAAHLSDADDGREQHVYRRRPDWPTDAGIAIPFDYMPPERV